MISNVAWGLRGRDKFASLQCAISMHCSVAETYFAESVQSLPASYILNEKFTRIPHSAHIALLEHVGKVAYSVGFQPVCKTRYQPLQSLHTPVIKPADPLLALGSFWAQKRLQKHKSTHLMERSHHKSTKPWVSYYVNKLYVAETQHTASAD